MRLPNGPYSASNYFESNDNVISYIYLLGFSLFKVKKKIQNNKLFRFVIPPINDLIMIILQIK